MINIELILGEGRSKVIKLVEKADVAKWVEPVCEILEKKKNKWYYSNCISAYDNVIKIKIKHPMIDA